VTLHADPPRNRGEGMTARTAGQGIEFHAEARGGFVHEIDGFAGQEAAGDFEREVASD
jgi:hypothetical protein